jgi:hypothetical protein
MSAYDQLREPLQAALQCARRIADIGPPVILHSHTHFVEEIRISRRDLPYLNRRALAAFPGDVRLADDLHHELACVEQDTFDFVDWIFKIHEKMNGPLITVRDATEGISHGKRFQEEYPQRQRRVYAACDRAQDVATRICGETDRLLEASPKIASIPIPTAATSPQQDRGQPDKKTDTKKKRAPRVPKNIDRLTALKKKIAKDAKRGMTQLESALEFTNGDETKAQSMLRALRRHRGFLGLGSADI